MRVYNGPVRYLFLRRLRQGDEDTPHWPPKVKQFDGAHNAICVAVRLYAEQQGWRVEYDENAVPRGDVAGALVLTRETGLGLLPNGRRVNADLGLLGVRVVNADEKGIEYATHLIVRNVAPLGSRRPAIAPIDSLLFGEYVESHARAEAELDLNLTPRELGEMPPFLPDEEIEREAKRAVDSVVLSTARFYSYGNMPKHGITTEVEAGRVSLYGRVDLASVGDQIRAALLETPGVVEVADHLLYIEQLKAAVEDALAAKGLDDVVVLAEHALISLFGEVPTPAARYQAEDIARRVPGVRGVVNNITVATTVGQNS